MQPPKSYHPRLAEQVRAILGESPNIPATVQTLLQRVSDTYVNYEQEQRTLADKVEQRTAQLVASTSQAYSFLDSLHMGLIMFDVNPEVVFTNLSVRHILSLKAPETGSRVQGEAQSWTVESINTLFGPEVQLKQLVLDSLSSSQPREADKVGFGSRVLRLFVAPMINETSSGKQQIGAVVLVEDITEQAVLERSRDEFFSIASHELRTPLTAIRGNTSLIQKYYPAAVADKDVAEMVTDIHESAVRLIEIVNDFLDVSALEQGKIQMKQEPFSPSEVISDVVRELQSVSSAKNLTLATDATAINLPAVFADKQRTKQIIYNLVGNALKYTEEGGVTIAAQADDSQVRITVTDTGPGIPPEGQSLLFRKFQQAGNSLLTRDSTKGTGLGLYISKLIVELSGGKIWLLDSSLGKGSSFAFTLPRAH